MTYKINHANIKDWAANYDGPLFDAILCDPPYELGFMGKSWDSSGIAFDTEMWADIYKLLKPGAHLLAFSGSRTYHRMACAIEDAGFEIRDMIEWVYGSGFPKSLNIGKAVDKLGKNPYGWLEFADTYKKIIEESKYTHNDIDKHLGIKASSCYWARKDHRGGLPPRHHWEKIKEFIDLDDKYDELYNEVEREVVGQKEVMGKDNDIIYGKYKGGIVDVTKGTSEWEGWGTALKPAHEPCVLARKPIEGNVAQNCLKYGVGGLAIDKTRIKTDYNLQRNNLIEIIRVCQLDHLLLPANSVELKKFQDDTTNAIKSLYFALESVDTPILEKTTGIMQDDIIKKITSCLEETLMENTNTSLNTFGYGKNPMDKSNQKVTKSITLTVLKMITDWKISSSSVSQLIEALHIQAKTLKTIQGVQGRFPSNLIHNGSDDIPFGEANRFFYTAKASKSERNAGLDGFEEKVTKVTNMYEMERENGTMRKLATKKNHHPTVKPLALTKYLANLIRPPKGGRLLVPFSGSGSEMIGALQAGWEYVEGVELTEEYIPIAEARIEYWLKKDKQAKLL